MEWSGRVFGQRCSDRVELSCPFWAFFGYVQFDEAFDSRLIQVFRGGLESRRGHSPSSLIESQTFVESAVL